MATHGTIMLQSKNVDKIDSILMQTPHDGHTDDAICMLLRLPHIMAERSYNWTILTTREIDCETYNASISREKIDHYFDNIGSNERFYLTSMANAITHCYWDRWTTYPDNIQYWLADYDLDPDAHIYVQIGDDVKTYFISSKYNEFSKKVLNVIDMLNQTVYEKIEIRDNGIFVPGFSLYKDRVEQLVNSIFEKVKAFKSANPNSVPHDLLMFSYTQVSQYTPTLLD